MNKELDSIPDGVVGYVYPFQLSRTSNSSKGFLGLKFVTANAEFCGENNVFQIRKVSSEQIMLVGFISDESQLVLAREIDFEGRLIIVFPVSHDEFRNEVQIPLTSDLVIVNRDIENESGKRIAILEIRKRETG